MWKSRPDPDKPTICQTFKEVKAALGTLNKNMNKPFGVCLLPVLLSPTGTSVKVGI
jgi:hypothetical protein